MMWPILITILSVLFGVYLVRGAALRHNRAHRSVRIAASVIALASLALMALKINYESEVVSNTAAGGIIVTTDGADRDSLSSFIEKNPSYKMINAGQQQLNIKADREWLLSIDSSSAVAIHIFGNGLDAYQLRRLANHQIYFHPPTYAPAFESVSWPSRLISGEPLRIQGFYNKSAKAPVKLLLQGFGITLDSVIFKDNGRHSFELSTIPRQSGRAVYNVSVVSENETLQNEKIPFEVITASTARVLILAAAPDFENRFLKNWLSQRGYALAIRTVTSRNKLNQELINLTGVPTGPVNSSLLNNFDLIIGDATALASLSASEKNAIRTSVAQQGLGLLIKADSATATSLFYMNDVKIKQSPVNNMQQVRLFEGDTGGLPFPVVSMLRPVFIDQLRGSRSLLIDSAGHVYASLGIAGSGKIITSTLTNTYSWVLAGDTLAYRRLWAGLINEAARKQLDEDSYQTVPALSYKGTAMTITAITPDSVPSRINVNRQMLPVQQNLLLPFQWDAFYWPRESGWQQLSPKAGSQYQWYVFQSSDWTDLKIAQKRKINHLAATHLKTIASTAGTSVIVQRTIHPVYFFIIFILCCSYLWIEEKYYNSRA